MYIDGRYLPYACHVHRVMQATFKAAHGQTKKQPYVAVLCPGCGIVLLQAEKCWHTTTATASAGHFTEPLAHPAINARHLHQATTT